MNKLPDSFYSYSYTSKSPCPIFDKTLTDGSRSDRSSLRFSYAMGYQKTNGLFAEVWPPNNYLRFSHRGKQPLENIVEYRPPRDKPSTRRIVMTLDGLVNLSKKLDLPSEVTFRVPDILKKVGEAKRLYHDQNNTVYAFTMTIPEGYRFTDYIRDTLTHTRATPSDLDKVFNFSEPVIGKIAKKQGWLSDGKVKIGDVIDFFRKYKILEKGFKGICVGGRGRGAIYAEKRSS